MEVKVYRGEIQESNADTIILNLFQGLAPGGAAQVLNEQLSGAISELIDSNDFSGQAGQVTVVYPRGSVAAKRVILVGLGKQEEVNLDAIRRAAAHGIKKANAAKAKQVVTILPEIEADKFSAETISQAIVEASRLALYQYKGQKNPKNGNDSDSMVEQLELYAATDDEEKALEQGIAAGDAIAAGVAVTRDLVNLPPNFCTPEYMASVAEQVAEQTGLKVEILEKAQMQALKMGALLAVAQGSDTPPRFIILEHNASRASELDTIVLVGKGVTFDTGGYSIKTTDGMTTMKSDMAGGGAVIGAMKAIAELKIPLHVVGLVPSADNMISGNAFRPQDVVTASNGVTIEIISTDAEGRMLLADALVYASRYKPAAVVDIATLTGACMVALGGVAAGLFSTDDRLRDKLIQAGDTVHERVWPLPIFSDYKKGIESDTADLKNSAGKPGGGASVAAVFLKHFIDYPAWAHLDMAGMAASDSGDPPYNPKGATGFGVRLFVEFVRRWANQ